MPLRRRAWLSREGLYYAGVLGFIMGGAVLRSINLLVVLAGMMLAPLLLNWGAVMASLRGLVVTRRLPEQVCAGEELIVEIAVENTRRGMGSLLLVVEDWIEREEEWGRRTVDRRQIKAPVNRWLLKHLMPFRPGVLRAETLVAHVPPLATATGTYRIKLHRRGKYRFGPLRVSTRYPLGLVWGHFTLRANAELIVGPRLGRFLPEWANLLESDQAGEQRRDPQRGIAEGDYYGLRPWQSGDSTRWIHWRTTAKLGTPTVVQFERQRNREVALMLDPYSPPAPQASGRRKPPGIVAMGARISPEEEEGLLELAISLAATAVADLTNRGHSRLTVAVAGREPVVWSGPASPLFCQEVLSHFAVLTACSNPALETTLARVRDEAPSGVRLIVVSPRSAAEAGTDPSDQLVWIDVGQSGLAELFTLS